MKLTISLLFLLILSARNQSPVVTSDEPVKMPYSVKDISFSELSTDYAEGVDRNFERIDRQCIIADRHILELKKQIEQLKMDAMYSSIRQESLISENVKPIN
jgi:hypothetical protein